MYSEDFDDEQTTVAILEGYPNEGPLIGKFRFTDWNEDTYTGELQEGMPHGQGYKQKANGEHFEGIFIHGRIDTGKGRWKVGEIDFTGEFKYGSFWSGFGRKLDSKGRCTEYIYNDGMLESEIGFAELESGLYKGALKIGFPHGKGVVKDATGKILYEGTFADGIFRTGVATFDERGTIISGVLKGFGKIIEEKRVRLGTFVNGELCGFGMEFSDAKELFLGHFREGKKSHGKLITSSFVMEGEFFDGKLDGKGSIKYIGCVIENGVLKGNSEEEFKNLVDFMIETGDLNEFEKSFLVGDYACYEEGKFREGKLNGQGFSSLYNCSRKGEFKDGKLHGKGKKIYKDGRVEEGVFIEDKFLEKEPSEAIFELRIDGAKVSDLSLATGLGRKVYSENFYEEGYFVCGELHNGFRVIHFEESFKLEYLIENGYLTDDVHVTNTCYKIHGKRDPHGGEMKKLVSLRNNYGQEFDNAEHYDVQSKLSNRITVDECGMVRIPNANVRRGKQDFSMCDFFGVSIANEDETISSGYDFNILFLNFQIAFNKSEKTAIVNAKVKVNGMNSFSSKMEPVLYENGNFKIELLDEHFDGYKSGTVFRFLPNNKVEVKHGVFKNAELVKGFTKKSNGYEVEFISKGEIETQKLLVNMRFQSLSFQKVKSQNVGVGVKIDGLIKREGKIVAKTLDMFDFEGQVEVSTGDYRVFGNMKNSVLINVDKVIDRDQKVIYTRLYKPSKENGNGIFVDERGLIVTGQFNCGKSGEEVWIYDDIGIRKRVRIGRDNYFYMEMKWGDNLIMSSEESEKGDARGSNR